MSLSSHFTTSVTIKRKMTWSVSRCTTSVHVGILTYNGFSMCGPLLSIIGLHLGNVSRDVAMGENPAQVSTFLNQFLKTEGSYPGMDFRTPGWVSASTKELQSLHKIGVHNSNSQSSTQEVAQSQWGLQVLGDHKDHKQSLLQLPILFDMRWSSRSLWKRKSVEMNQFKSWKLAEIGFEWKHLKQENLKSYFQ